MNKALIGAFVFTSAGYGILSGVYNNNHETIPYPENAKRKDDSIQKEDLFEGIYTTVWLERKGRHDKTDLIIKKLPDNTYELTWYDTEQIYYKGLAFIYNNQLTGSYWEV